MRRSRLGSLLCALLVVSLLVCAGMVSCGPKPGLPPEPGPGRPPLGEQPPGGPLPGEGVPGGAPPGGELQVIFVAQPEMVPPGGCATLHWEIMPAGEYRVLLNGQEVLPLGTI